MPNLRLEDTCYGREICPGQPYRAFPPIQSRCWAPRPLGREARQSQIKPQRRPQPLSLSLLFRRRTVVSKGESNCVDNLGWRAQWRLPWEPAVGSPFPPPPHPPIPALRLKWQPHPHPWVFAVMTLGHQPGHSFPEIPSPSSTFAPLTPLADGTPPLSFS